MKSFVVKSLITAAAMTAISGIAAAESLKVEIPFAFRAGSTMMAPGTYVFTTNPKMVYAAAIQVRHYDSIGGILMLATVRDAGKQWTNAAAPRVQFDCMEGRCRLTRVWDGRTRDALEPLGPKISPRENASLSTITLSAISVK
jgi:hypothetical protein